jgi:nitric oxide reductase activation protein
MKKYELTKLIRETVTEVFNEAEHNSEFNNNIQQTNEGTPPNFPPALKKKLISKYGKTPKAYATMWTLSKKMDEGNDRVKEMWMQFENKHEVNEQDVAGEETSQDTEHDETDLSNPEENAEVKLANQIKTLANKLLAMHGAESDDGDDDMEDEDGDDTATLSVTEQKKKSPLKK